MTKLEKDLVMECLKEYEIGGRVSINAVENVLGELVSNENEPKGE